MPPSHPNKEEDGSIPCVIDDEKPRLAAFLSLLETQVSSSNAVLKAEGTMDNGRLVCLLASDDDGIEVSGEPADATRLNKAAFFPSLSLSSSKSRAAGSNKTPTSPPSQGMECCTNDTHCTRLLTSSEAKKLAIHNLALPIPHKRSNMQSAPASLARNALDSFAMLVGANLRQFFKIQLQKNFPKTEESNFFEAKSREIAASYFCSNLEGDDENWVSRSHPVRILRARTHFRVCDNTCTKENAEARSNKYGYEEKSFVFFVMVEIDIHGSTFPVSFQAPGQITGSFPLKENSLMDQVKLTINTEKLLLSMRNQARLIVLKVVTFRNVPTDDLTANLKETQAPLTVVNTFGDKFERVVFCATLQLASITADINCLANCEAATRKKPSEESSLPSRKRLFRCAKSNRHEASVKTKHWDLYKFTESSSRYVSGY